jgi:mono/diheme cytochrome c family protein
MGTTNTSKRATIFAGMAGLGAAMLVLGVMVAVAPQPAEAQPAYAQQTGLHCAMCHENAAGGGKRTKLGERFLMNGLKLPKNYKK